ncbi:unnamed protein product [Camellia sinensis]
MAGVDLVAELVGVTLGPKGRNVVLQNKYGPPKIVNDGETILKEIKLEDPLENVGVKLVRQAGAKTNDIAGDGSATSIVLAQGLIFEGVKVIAAGMNPIQISQGIEKTTKALVSELKQMSREGTVIRDDMGLTLEKAGKEVLGTATKVVIPKDSTLIVTDGSTQAAVKKRVSQIQKLVEIGNGGK